MEPKTPPTTIPTPPSKTESESKASEKPLPGKSKAPDSVREPPAGKTRENAAKEKKRRESQR